jgi:hypothetical protein
VKGCNLFLEGGLNVLECYSVVIAMFSYAICYVTLVFFSASSLLKASPLLSACCSYFASCPAPACLSLSSLLIANYSISFLNSASFFHCLLSHPASSSYSSFFSHPAFISYPASLLVSHSASCSHSIFYASLHFASFSHAISIPYCARTLHYLSSLCLSPLNLPTSYVACLYPSLEILLLTCPSS